VPLFPFDVVVEVSVCTSSLASTPQKVPCSWFTSRFLVVLKGQNQSLIFPEASISMIVPVV